MPKEAIVFKAHELQDSDMREWLWERPRFWWCASKAVSMPSVRNVPIIAALSSTAP